MIGRGHALVVHGPAGRVLAAPRVPVVAHLLRLAAEEHDGPFGRLHQQLGIDRDLALGLGADLRDHRCGQDAAQRHYDCAKPNSACHVLLLLRLMGNLIVNDGFDGNQGVDRCREPAVCSRQQAVGNNRWRWAPSGREAYSLIS